MNYGAKEFLVVRLEARRARRTQLAAVSLQTAPLVGGFSRDLDRLPDVPAAVHFSRARAREDARG